MEKPFTRVGKQIMASGSHYADSANETAAQFMLEALNTKAFGITESLLAAVERLVNDVDDLMGHSEGVIGLHLNGDVAPWSELGEGGQSEPWLGEALHQSRAAIARATGAGA